MRTADVSFNRAGKNRACSSAGCRDPSRVAEPNLLRAIVRGSRIRRARRGPTLVAAADVAKSLTLPRLAGEFNAVVACGTVLDFGASLALGKRSAGHFAKGVP